MTSPGDGIDRPRVVVSEFLPELHLAMLRERVDVTYDPDLYTDRPRLLGELDGAVALIIRNRTIVDDELLDAAKEMRVVGRLGVGLDNIDIEATDRHGVAVYPAHGGNAVSVAEYVMGAMMVLVRGVFAMTESMRAGEWPRQGHAFGNELSGKTLGLVGLGAIAREVAKRALAFDMTVTAHDPFLGGDHVGWSLATPIDFESLIELSDVVSIHVPLDEETHHLVDADVLSRMRPTAILVNTSRGGTVDEDALATALRQGAIGGAVLDVFANEPLGPESAARFRDLDNVLLTPHIAGNTTESVDRVATMTVTTVLREIGMVQPPAG